MAIQSVNGMLQLYNTGWDEFRPSPKPLGSISTIFDWLRSKEKKKAVKKAHIFFCVRQRICNLGKSPWKTPQWLTKLPAVTSILERQLRAEQAGAFCTRFWRLQQKRCHLSASLTSIWCAQIPVWMWCMLLWLLVCMFPACEALWLSRRAPTLPAAATSSGDSERCWEQTPSAVGWSRWSWRWAGWPRGSSPPSPALPAGNCFSIVPAIGRTHGSYLGLTNSVGFPVFV